METGAATMRNNFRSNPSRLSSRLSILFSMFLLLAAAAQARRGAPPRSSAVGSKSLDTVPMLLLPGVDTRALLAQDAANKSGGPLRFAIPVAVDISPAKHGAWEELADGGRLWRYRFDSPEASDLNFGFNKMWLPPGATLHVLSEEYDYYEGPYTYKDNEEHGQLWIPVVPGGKAVVELYMPAVAKAEPILRLSQVATGYRDFHRVDQEHLATKQGTCNNDVICPEGDPWRDQIRSAAVYSIGGIFLCSGQMVADVPGTFRNFFLTANHCGLSTANASTMTVYWNYESPVCGALSGGSLDQNQTGATFRAARADVDFALVELDDDPDPVNAVFYAGWDRSADIPGGQTVGIHHPSTDEKSISFNEDPLTIAISCIGGGTPNSHWVVDSWEDGTTEGGSSGSGLWDSNTKRIIGHLSGGLAACGNMSSDCYGRFTVAWDGVNSSSRLKDWLDPANADVMAVDGSDPSPQIFFNSHLGIDTCASDAANSNGVWEPGEEVELQVTVRSSGEFSGVSGTLTTSTPGVMIVDADATFPNLSSGDTATSDGPHFTVSLAESVTCLSRIDFELSVQANEGGPFALSFSNDVGLSLAPNVPIAIPDGLGANMPGAAAESTLVVGDNVILNDVNVQVHIDHTWIGDVEVRLRAPDGTEIVLLDRAGSPTTTSGCNNDNIDVLFDDDSAVDPEGICTGNTNDLWPVNEAAPVGSLADLAGKSAMGTWTLLAFDSFNADTGTLIDWELITDPPISGTCSVCEATGPPPPPPPTLPPLSLTKRCGGTVRGKSMAYCDLAVYGVGPGAVTNVVVTDPLPVGVSWVGDDCGLSVAGQDLTWNVGTVPDGALITCRVMLNVMGDPATITNVATAVGTGAPPVQASASLAGQSPELAIPTLGDLGLLLLMLGLLGSGLLILKRR
jgi:subtilisin-like proprotein convertase family protein